MSGARMLLTIEGYVVINTYREQNFSPRRGFVLFLLGLDSAILRNLAGS